MGVAKGAGTEGSARERLLTAANELFYREGIHTVGIERVLEHAGVAKASLYSTFGSKDGLVRAYLEGRAERRRQRITERIAQVDSPREKILAIFDHFEETCASTTYRGCAFVNASAEEPDTDTSVRKVSAEARAWLQNLFVELAEAFGARNAKQLGRQLAILCDGAVVGASMDRDREVVGEARAVAELLLEKHGSTAKPAKRAR